MKHLFISLLVVVVLLITHQSFGQNYVWAKNIGNEIGAGVVSCNVAVDQNGNTFIAGRFTGTVDFDPGSGVANFTTAGDFDIFFAKYDANGNYQWAKQIGSDMSEICWAMTLDGSGNIIIAGYYGNATDFDPGNGTANLSFNGGEDCFIAKYSNDGNYMWAKGFGAQSLDQISKIDIDGSGNIYVAGFFQGVVDFDPGSGISELTVLNVGPNDYNLFFAKYDASGNYVWAKQIATNTTQICIAADATGNAYVAGSFGNIGINPIDFDLGNGTANLSSAGASDIFFAKYDNNGNYVFAKGMGGASIQGGLDKATDIDVDNGGNIYLCGIFGQTTDFDPGSGTANLTSVWSGDMFFAKYNASGDYQWAHQLQSDDYSTLNIHVAANNDILLSGSFAGTTDFDFGSGTAELTSTGDQDIFFAKYDVNGNYLSAAGMGYINGNDFAMDVTTDNIGNIYATGVFTDNADFDPGAGTATLTSAVSFGQDVFFGKYTQGPVSIDETTERNNFIDVYPNPSAGNFTVETNYSSSAPYLVTDISGRVVSKGYFTKGKNEIQLSNAESGIYFLNTEAEKIKLVKK